MSDCAHGGRRPRVWNDTVWHSPSGRDIRMSQPEEPHEATFELADGTRRHTHWAGPRALAVDVDGERWVPAPRRDWDAEAIE